MDKEWLSVSRDIRRLSIRPFRIILCQTENSLPCLQIGKCGTALLCITFKGRLIYEHDLRRFCHRQDQLSAVYLSLSKERRYKTA